MTDLRITDVKTYIVPPSYSTDIKWCDNKSFLFVKIETNRGIDGWGECYTLGDRERSTQMLIKEMKRYLLDFDPSMIKRFQHWTYNQYSEQRSSIDLACAISGVEIAMWDILGKYYNTPVYKLLGGPVHKKLRAYANLAANGFKTPEEVAEQAKEMVKLGFTAVKVYPFDFGEEDKAVLERVIKVREAVGDNVDILVDVWRQAEPKRVIRIAKKMEPLNIVWFEEPIASDNLDVMADIRNKINLPVVTGECIWAKRAFNDVFKKQAADIINPDVSVVGGILELKEIAIMAEANYVKIGPHNSNSSTVSTSASVHASCTMPNFYMLETFPDSWAIGKKICKNPLPIIDGYYHITDASGLGLEMNEDFLASQVYKERPIRSGILDYKLK